MVIAEDYIPFDGFEFIDDISKVSESAQSEVANSKGTILAIVKGKHFCPGGVSRNHRLYTEELWKSVGENDELKHRMDDNQMLGRIGHEAEMTDEDIADGKFSHYTRNINWETGEAEDVILNTPMGNTLYTLLRSGVKLYVSSRADGDYNGKDEDGNDILDPETYKLERFDFVQDPGFLEAKPKMITESVKKTEAAHEKQAEALLDVARRLGAPVELDDSEYIVESMGAGKVSLGGMSGTEDCSLNDFTEVTADIAESIVKYVDGLRRELDESKDTIKMLRFANSNGLDEDYVERKIGEGATYESLAHEKPKPRQFKMVEAKMDEPADSGDDVSFLNTIFG